MSVVYSSGGPFSGTGGAALPAGWSGVTGLNAITLTSNEASNIVGGAGGARWTTNAMPNDGIVQITVGSVVSTTTDEGVGPAARVATAAQTMYFGQTNTHETRLYKCVATTFTQLGSDGVACATGDTLAIVFTGTSISLKKNGTTIVGPVTDSSIASGQGGMYASATGAGSVSATSGFDSSGAGGAQATGTDGVAKASMTGINGVANASIAGIDGATF